MTAPYEISKRPVKGMTLAEILEELDDLFAELKRLLPQLEAQRG